MQEVYHRGAGHAPVLSESLAPHHLRALLEESGIAPEIVAERGYGTIADRAEVPEAFNKNQRRVPALGIPVYSPAGETFTRLRPDSPRPVFKRSGGKWIPKGVVKYEQPKGREIVIDVHPRNAESVRDGGVDLWVTEGEKKGDSLASRGLCAVALFGVDCWGRGGELLPDWDHVVLDGRNVYVVFDSDVMVKPEVQSALERLTGALEARGAEVKVVYLPDAEDGSKRGVDDYLVAGGTVEGLYALARPFERTDHTRVRLSRDGRLRASVAALWKIWEGILGNRNADYTRRAIYRVLVEEAGRRGRPTSEGVGFYLAGNDGAMLAGVSQPTFSKHARAMEDEGYLKVERPEDKAKANRYVLLTAPRAVGNMNGGLGQREGEGVEGEGEVTSSLPAPSSPRYSQLRTHHDGEEIPELRWSRTVMTWRKEDGIRVCEADHLARLGKRSGEIIRYLYSSGGSSSVASLMETFAGKKARRRDFEKRVLGPIVGRGNTPAIVAVEGDVVRLRYDWRDQLEKAREVGEEQAAGHMQMVNYEIKKAAFRNRDSNPVDRAPTEAEMDAIREERERRRREDLDSDGYIGELEPVVEPVEDDDEEEPPMPAQNPAEEPHVLSDLAVSIREYLSKNPDDVEQSPYWIGKTLWAHDLYPGNPTAAESTTAIYELGGQGRLRYLLRNGDRVAT